MVNRIDPRVGAASGTVSRCGRAVSSLSLAAALAWAAPALADEVEDQGGVAGASAENANAGGGSPIIVTAQRRAESAQDVPIAVAVLQADELSAMGAFDTNALTGKIPTLTVANSGSQLYFLRGVGTTGSSNNVEQSVASYLDGVYLYSTWSAAVPLAGVERVEVLKGPQGTLFGRNTTAGVIQTVTRDPLAPPTLQANIGYGNYDTVTGSFYGSTRISDTFGVSLTLDYRDQGEGYGFNTIRNEEIWSSDNFSAMVKAVFEPTDRTRLTALFWYNEYDSTGYHAQIVPGTRGLDGVERTYDRFESFANTPDSFDYESYLGYFRLDQDLGFAQLMSLTSFRHVNQFFDLDQDAVPVTVVDAFLDIPIGNFAQEVQLLSPDDSPFDWLIGAYYFNGTAKYDPIELAGAVAGAAGQIEFYRSQETESLAGFAQVTVPVFDETNFTAGIRYTDETITLPESTVTSFGTPLFTNPSDEVDSSGWTWRLSLDHNFTPEVLGYISYNRGLKSGGFPLVTATNLPPYMPERLDAFEIGVKTEFADRRIRINAAAFLYQFDDIQVTQIAPGGNVVTNAAGAEIWGVDMDFELRPSNNLTIYGALGYLSGHYTDYQNAIAYDPRPAPAGGASTRIFDATGQRTVYTPQWSFSVGATQIIPTEIGDFSINAFVQHVDDQFVGADNALILPSYTVVNGSIGWQSSDEHLSIRVWARNLFDDVYFSNMLESGVGYLQIPAAPRTFGVTIGTSL